MKETEIPDGKKTMTSGLNFYYDREERLNKASQRVRDLYKEMPKRRFALFSSLTDTKPKSAMFISIVAACLIIVFISKFTAANGESLAGNLISASVMRYEGSSFVVLKKKASGKKPFEGIVDVSVVDTASNAVISTRQIVFTTENSEEFRWSVTGESKNLRFFLQTGGSQKYATASIDVKPD